MDCKVGDKIVELDQVFRIFKISNAKNKDGNSEKIIFFKPYFSTKLSDTMVCSIPEKNIDKTNIRKPISKKRLGELKKLLLNNNNIKQLPDINKAKELLKSNDPIDIVTLLKALTKEKNASDHFPKSKRDIIAAAIEGLAQEFALVNQSSLETAKERISIALQS